MRILAESPEHILEGVVRDDADLDGQFEMFTDDGETLVLNGWLWIIDTLERRKETPMSTRDLWGAEEARYRRVVRHYIGDGYANFRDIPDKTVTYV